MWIYVDQWFLCNDLQRSKFWGESIPANFERVLMSQAALRGAWVGAEQTRCTERERYIYIYIFYIILYVYTYTFLMSIYVVNSVVGTWPVRFSISWLMTAWNHQFFWPLPKQLLLRWHAIALPKVWQQRQWWTDHGRILWSLAELKPQSSESDMMWHVLKGFISSPGSMLQT